VTAAATAALAARGVVVDRDAVADLETVDPVSQGADHTGGLVPQYSRQLALNIPIDHIRRADAAGEDVADDLAGPGSRVIDVLDPDVVKRD
jgi:hypothetical protein